MKKVIKSITRQEYTTLFLQTRIHEITQELLELTPRLQNVFKKILNEDLYNSVGIVTEWDKNKAREVQSFASTSRRSGFSYPHMCDGLYGVMYALLTDGCEKAETTAIHISVTQQVIHEVMSINLDDCNIDPGVVISVHTSDGQHAYVSYGGEAPAMNACDCIPEARTFLAKAAVMYANGLLRTCAKPQGDLILHECTHVASAKLYNANRNSVSFVHGYVRRYPMRNGTRKSGLVTVEAFFRGADKSLFVEVPNIKEV